MEFDVLVIGSINYDITVMTQHFPGPGETVMGSSHFVGPGGKGANQAVAASRLGARVGMVARVGDDEWGRALVNGLAGEGVDVAMIGIDHDVATGMASIVVDEKAENTIVLSPGANMRLTPDQLAEHAAAISKARVVLTQLEIPLATVEASAGYSEGFFCLNPAPALLLPESLLRQTDLLIPNRAELAFLTSGLDITTVDDAVAAVRALKPQHATVVTLGAEGALLVDGAIVEHYAPFEADAVDPTGAGDTFCGALAASLSQGSALGEAVRFATAAGAIAVTQAGAQSGMPVRADVEALLAV